MEATTPTASRRIIEVCPRRTLRRRALQAAHGAGEETEHVRYGGQFVQQHGVERLAAVVRLQASEHVRLGIDALGKLEQQGRAILGGVCDQASKAASALCTAAWTWAPLASVIRTRTLPWDGLYTAWLAFAGHQGTIDQKFGLHIDSRH